MRDLSNLVEDYYLNYYEKVHGSQWGESKLSFHKDIEKPFDLESNYPDILEVGAGEGQHLKFISHQYSRYLATDLREIANAELLPIKEGHVPNYAGNFRAYGDATSLAYGDGTFDRVVAGCLLLHLADPLKAVDEWYRVLKKGGRIDALIPRDESFLVGIYRSLFSRRKATKLGFKDFDLVNALEHVTHYSRVLRLSTARYDSTEIGFTHFPPILGKFKIFRAYSIMRIIKK